MNNSEHDKITDPQNVVSMDVLLEAAYLIERRVRPIALCGTATIENDIQRMRLMQKLNEAAINCDVKQFILDFGNGMAQYGFASSACILDLYQWTMLSEIPSIQKERIFGLLFGYSIESIARFEELSNGRLIYAPH